MESRASSCHFLAFSSSFVEHVKESECRRPTRRAKTTPDNMEEGGKKKRSVHFLQWRGRKQRNVHPVLMKSRLISFSSNYYLQARTCFSLRFIFKGSLQQLPPAFITNSRLLIEMFSVALTREELVEVGHVRLHTPHLTISRPATRATPSRAAHFKERGCTEGLKGHIQPQLLITWLRRRWRAAVRV